MHYRCWKCGFWAGKAAGAWISSDGVCRSCEPAPARPLHPATVASRPARAATITAAAPAEDLARARSVLAFVVAVVLAALLTVFPTSARSDTPAVAGTPGGNRNAGCHQQDDVTGGPYDANCTGAPSQNGNGQGGSGTPGPPCAGCVGQADNQQPPGQMPGGSDGNTGYECDSNSGVGQGNPAHTSCTAAPDATATATPSPPVTPTPPLSPSPPITPTPPVTPTPRVTPSQNLGPPVTPTPAVGSTPSASPPTGAPDRRDPPPGPPQSEGPPSGRPATGEPPPRVLPDSDDEPSRRGPRAVLGERVSRAVLGERISRAPQAAAPQVTAEAAAQPAPASPERDAAAVLPFTGAPLVPFLLLGAAMTLNGVALVRGCRAQ